MEETKDDGGRGSGEGGGGGGGKSASLQSAETRRMLQREEHNSHLRTRLGKTLTSQDQDVEQPSTRSTCMIRKSASLVETHKSSDMSASGHLLWAH